MPKSSKKRVARKKPSYKLVPTGTGYIRMDARKLTEAELKRGVTTGLRRIAATQRRSRRTQEEIARLREESRALLEEL